MSKENCIVLETERLIFKPVSMNYVKELTALRGDPDVMKYISQGLTQTQADVEDFINNGKDYYKTYGLDFFCVFTRKGEFIGQAGLIHTAFNPNSAIELAYRFHKKFWGQGYATECANVLLDWGFTHHQLNKIVAFVHPDNNNSRRVLEKAGMMYQGMKLYRDTLLPAYEICNKKLILQQRKQLIYELEISLLDSTTRHSISYLKQHIAEEFIEYGSSGLIYTKDIVLDRLPQETPQTYLIENFSILELSNETVLATYRLTRATIHSLRSSIWQYKDNRWQMIFHQGTPYQKR